MRRAGKELADPGERGGEYVVLNLLAVMGFAVDATEGRVGEAGVAADALEEGNVGQVEVPGAPG